MSLERVELAVIAAELGVGMLAGFAFIAAYWRSPWGKSAAGRHMMYVSAAWAGEMGTLLAMVAGLRVPLWVFMLGYAAADAVVMHRLWLLYRARRTPSDAR